MFKTLKSETDKIEKQELVWYLGSPSWERDGGSRGAEPICIDYFYYFVIDNGS